MNANLDVIENINAYIKYFESMYFQEYKIPYGLKYKILIVDDIAQATNEFMKKKHNYFVVDESDYNGTTCLPNVSTAEIEIYISKKIVENYHINSWQFICTVFHELTHAVDFYNYCNKWFQGDYDSMISKSDPYGFHMWTEFNAKQKSYLLYSHFLRNCMKDNNTQFGKPIDGELEFQNDFITKSINENSSSKAVYDVIQYLGRYYCWEIDFQDDFIDGKLFPEIFKQKLEPEISNLYKKLKESENSIMYYNELAKLMRLLIGKIVMINN